MTTQVEEKPKNKPPADKQDICECRLGNGRCVNGSYCNLKHAIGGNPNDCAQKKHGNKKTVRARMMSRMG